MIKNDFKTIDEYIAIQPKEVAILLEKVRATIKKAAPEATEAISYAIPTFKLYGNLVHFANFKNHAGARQYRSRQERGNHFSVRQYYRSYGRRLCLRS